MERDSKRQFISTFSIKFDIFDLLIDIKVIFFDLLIKVVESNEFNRKWSNLIKRRLKIDQIAINDLNSLSDFLSG